MKNSLLALFSLISFGAFAQNFSPSVLTYLDFILQGNLPRYSRIINNDVSTQPADSLSALWLNKDMANNYRNGYELNFFDGDTIYWTGSINGNLNSVTLIGKNDTLREVLYKDAQGFDTLIQSYIDTTGNGTLELAQEMELTPGATGLDSITLYVYQGGTRTPVLKYGVSRDSATQRIDTVEASIIFSGFTFLIQRLDFYYGATGLDSINLFDPMNNEIIEQIRISQNSAGLISSFTVYDRDSASAPWEAYDYYLYDNAQWVGLAETSKKVARFFPNPAKDWLQIQSNGNGDLMLYRLDGSLVKTWRNHNFNQRVDLSGIPSGFYLLKVDQEGQQTQAKVQLR